MGEQDLNRRGSEPGLGGRRRDEPLWSRGAEQPVNWAEREGILRQARSVEDRLPQEQPASRESLVEAIHKIYRRPGR